MTNHCLIASYSESNYSFHYLVLTMKIMAIKPRI